MGLLIHKELAHAVRLRILARRNDSNRKRIFKLVADSSQLMSFILIPAFLTTCTDPSHSFRMTINVSLITTLFHPIVILNGGKNAL